MNKYVKFILPISFLVLGALLFLYLAVGMFGNTYDNSYAAGIDNSTEAYINQIPTYTTAADAYTYLAVSDLQTKGQVEISYRKLELQNYLLIFLLFWIIIGISILIYQASRRD